MKYHFISLNPEQEENAALARNIVYIHIAEKLPKICSCGREHKREIEYTNRTERAGNALFEEETLTFARNCPCGNTMYMVLDLNEWNKKEKDCVKTYLNDLGKVAKNDFQVNSITGPTGKYISSTDRLCLHSVKELAPYRGNIKKTLESLDEIRIADYFWQNVALNIFRDIHNDFVREKEKHLMPKHRVLIINPRKNEFGDFYLPDTKISYRQTLLTGKKALNDNPEGTSAIILDLEDQLAQHSFIEWLRKHDSSNSGNIPELIKGYQLGKILPVFSFGNKKPFDEHHFILQKPCYELTSIVQDSFKKHHEH